MSAQAAVAVKKKTGGLAGIVAGETAISAAGGAHNAIFPITLAALQRATGGVMMDVVREASAE